MPTANGCGPTARWRYRQRGCQLRWPSTRLATCTFTGGFASPTATFGAATLINSPNNAGVYELFVAKIDALGSWQWARSGGGGGQDIGFDIAVDGANNVYITGFVQSTLGQFGPFALPANTYSADDVLVAKLDARGTWLWAVRAGSLSIDEAYGIAVDAVGNAYVTGRFSGATATFGPFTLTNGGPLYGYGGTDELFVAKLSPAGVWQWAVRGGGDSNDAGHSIALDGTGRLQVVGNFNSAVAQLGAFQPAQYQHRHPLQRPAAISHRCFSGLSQHQWRVAGGRGQPGAR